MVNASGNVLELVLKSVVCELVVGRDSYSLVRPGVYDPPINIRIECGTLSGQLSCGDTSHWRCNFRPAPYDAMDDFLANIQWSAFFIVCTFHRLCVNSIY